MVSNLLIDGHALIVLPQLAVKVGLNEAIVLQQIHYWTKGGRPSVDGLSWTYNSMKDWQKQFPFFSISTLRRTIDSLVDQGLLVRKKMADNPFDQTLYYAILHEKLTDMQPHTAQPEVVTEAANPCAQNEQIRSAQNEQITSTKNTKTTESDVVSYETLLSEGIQEKEAEDFLKQRKRQRKPLTARSWGALKREAGKAGWPLQAAVEIVLENQWQSFKASFVASLPVPGSVGGNTPPDAPPSVPGVGRWN